APTTTTVSPILVCAVLTTEPHPVSTPQLTSATTRSGICGSTFTHAFSDTTAYCENVPIPQNPPKPSAGNEAPAPPAGPLNRNVPSAIWPMFARPPLSHRLHRPDEHQ